jgi:glutamate-ammonia-ligase adenylyltransferase
MTLIAELAVARAVEVLGKGLAERYGTPRGADGRAQELIVIGMGKLGGRELNVSSDIDLIFVYPEDGDTDGAAVDFQFRVLHPPRARPDQRHRRRHRGRPGVPRRHAPAAQRRFRPAGVLLRHAGKLLRHPGPRVGALRLDQGAAADRFAPDELEAIRRPFVFRKYLDFGAINAMRELHAQIRQEVAKKDKADNVKLGPGGIREIEFIAQVFQLIRGGRDPGAADQADAAGAAAAGRARPPCRRGGGRTFRRLRLPAPRRTPPAIPRRRPDPHAADR